MFPCVDDDIQNCVSRLIYFLIIRKFDTDSPCFLVFFFQEKNGPQGIHDQVSVFKHVETNLKRTQHHIFFSS